MVYFYRDVVDDPRDIVLPIAPTLLVAPMSVGTGMWRDGYCVHYMRSELQPTERLSRHVFSTAPALHPSTPPFVDEYHKATEPPSAGESVGTTGVAGAYIVDGELSTALGIPEFEKSDKPLSGATVTMPELVQKVRSNASGARSKVSVSVCITSREGGDGEWDLGEIEDDLIGSVESAKAGHWEGRPTTGTRGWTTPGFRLPGPRASAAGLKSGSRRTSSAPSSVRWRPATSIICSPACPAVFRARAARGGRPREWQTPPAGSHTTSSRSTRKPRRT